MSERARVTTSTPVPGAMEARRLLLQGIPVSERRLEPAGMPTVVLQGGEGPPLVLLHGPGESAVSWRRVLPELVATHRVVAPDLPGHGAAAGEAAVDPERVLDWLEELIESTCATPPVLVGHVLGGAIAARFAARRGERIRRLVLVDALGLGRFRPTFRFAFTMIRFLARPSPGSYDPFMRQCSFDLDGLKEDLGDCWPLWEAYSVALARGPGARAAGRLMRRLGVPRIPPEELARIEVPTALIWGREDRAVRLRIAEAAHARYGWPLYVIDDCADDPPRDRPREFLVMLERALEPATDGEPRTASRSSGS